MPLKPDMLILVVDDHQNMRFLIKNSLNQCGYKNLDFAEDGVTALRKLRTLPVELVLLDWRMEGMDGLEVLQQLRSDQNPVIARTPVLMLTAEAGKKEVLIAIENGANDYIVKPFRATVLDEKIRDIFIEDEDDDEYGA